MSGKSSAAMLKKKSKEVVILDCDKVEKPSQKLAGLSKKLKDKTVSPKKSPSQSFLKSIVAHTVGNTKQSSSGPEKGGDGLPASSGKSLNNTGNTSSLGTTESVRDASGTTRSSSLPASINLSKDARDHYMFSTKAKNTTHFEGKLLKVFSSPTKKDLRSQLRLCLKHCHLATEKRNKVTNEVRNWVFEQSEQKNIIEKESIVLFLKMRGLICLKRLCIELICFQKLLVYFLILGHR